MTKAKRMIENMESRCNNDLVSRKCAGVPCKDCSLNQKYKDFVGIGMDEIWY